MDNVEEPTREQFVAQHQEGDCMSTTCKKQAEYSVKVVFPAQRRGFASQAIVLYWNLEVCKEHAAAKTLKEMYKHIMDFVAQVALASGIACPSERSISYVWCPLAEARKQLDKMKAKAAEEAKHRASQLRVEGAANDEG